MNPQNLVDDAIGELKRANHDSRHPFRYFSLGTALQGVVDQRTVVMRRYEGFVFSVFTDSRSPKVAQLTAQPQCHALFWHPKKCLQVRARLDAKLDHGKVDPDSVGSLKDYNTIQSPGEVISDALEFIDSFDTENVLKIVLSIRELDVLQLDRAQHHRAIAIIENEAISQVRSLVP